MWAWLNASSQTIFGHFIQKTNGMNSLPCNPLGWVIALCCEKQPLVFLFCLQRDINMIYFFFAIIDGMNPCIHRFLAWKSLYKWLELVLPFKPLDARHSFDKFSTQQQPLAPIVSGLSKYSILNASNSMKY